jgi:hypothetical protein
LILNAPQQDELVAISQSRSPPAGYVFRAKLILMLAEGADPVEIFRSDPPHPQQRCVCHMPLAALKLSLSYVT